ncbi:hypothetical protein HanRHA438_Chr10g0435841 [Helianthus annuus]|nr:hypothetical protein HanRHA438_Chr10g0435841 [Helianthus annuus]
MVLNLALIDSQRLRFRVFILFNHPRISWLSFCCIQIICRPRHSQDILKDPKEDKNLKESNLKMRKFPMLKEPNF